MSIELKCYVACLGCYNAGKLIGKWVDACDAGDLDCAAVGCTSGEHEELQVHDWEADGVTGLGEMSPTEAAEIGELAEGLGDEFPAFVAWRDNVGAEWDDESGFRDAYCGEHRSGEEFAEDLAEDTGAIPAGAAWPLTHINWEAAWRDLGYGDYYELPATGGNVWIFRNI